MTDDTRHFRSEHESHLALRRRNPLAKQSSHHLRFFSRDLFRLPILHGLPTAALGLMPNPLNRALPRLHGGENVQQTQAWDETMKPRPITIHIEFLSQILIEQQNPGREGDVNVLLSEAFFDCEEDFELLLRRNLAHVKLH